MTGPPTPQRPSATRTRAAVTWCGSLAAATGLAVLAGRALGLELPHWPLPDAGAMNPDAAFLFIVLGAAMAIIRWRERAPRLSATAIGIGSAIAGVAAGSAIVQRLAIDALPAGKEIAAASLFPPHRMDIPTAVSFLFLAVALTLAGGRSQWSGTAMRALAVTTGALAAAVFVGYLYRTPPFPAPASATPAMAVQTAFGLALLSFGVLASRPWGWTAVFSRSTAAGDLARKIVPAGIVAFLLIGRLHLAMEKTVLGPELSFSIVKVASMIVLIALVTWWAGLLDRTQAETTESEERFRATFEQAAVGIAHVALDGTFLRVNERFCEIAGRPRDELRGMTFQEIIHPDDLDAGLARARALIDGTVRSDSIERRHVRGDGSIVWVHLTESIVRDPGGSPKYFIAVVEDITRRREIEAALAAARGELERRVEERTAELAYERDRLRDTAAELLHVNRELEAFAHSVSHDLRAPLRAIEGFGRVLEQRAGAQLDAEARHLLDRMRAAAVRMETLIDALLRLARLSQGPLTCRHVDLTAAARRIAGELRAADPHREAVFVIAEGMSADADPALVEVLLRNLLGNAWKFTSKQARAKIEVGTAEGAFFVRDEGAGFDMEHASRLFQPFERLHSHEEFEGTGIGLATVRRIVHRHGGTIWPEAAPEKGATFFFTLGTASRTPPALPQPNMEEP